MTLLREWANENQIEGTNEALCQNPKFKAMLLENLRVIGANAQLQPYEIPSDILVETSPFSIDNGLLTHSFKLNRPVLIKKYKESLDKLHDDFESSLLQNKLIQLLKQILGIELESSLDPNSNLKSFGVDSLSAVRLSKELKLQLNVDLSVHLLFGSDISLSNLVDLIENSKNNNNSLSKNSLDVDWKAETTLPQDIVQLLKEMKTDNPLPTFGNWKHIVLTGVTGFLGTFLLHVTSGYLFFFLI